MGTRKLLAAASCALAVAGAVAGGASAGEITGNGKWIAGSEEAPLNGTSECAYSGLNDGYILGGESDRTQSWGQIVRHEGLLGGASFGCNPHGAPSEP